MPEENDTDLDKEVFKEEKPNKKLAKPKIRLPHSDQLIQF